MISAVRAVRDLRLIPIALIASGCLLTLKLADIAFDGSALLGRDQTASGGDVAVRHPMPDATAPEGSKLSWAQQMFNFPDGSGAAPIPSRPKIAPVQLAARDNAAGDITGSVPQPPAKEPADAKPPGATPPSGSASKPATEPNGTLVSIGGVKLPTGAERAILERLEQRRRELDNRAHELDLRESLIESAQKRMDAKLAELKQVEAQIKAATDQKNSAEKARLTALVTMYENMKPRDAAKIFDGLDTGVLIEVASRINPRTMADIVAQMQPDVAERLTVELANQAQQQNNKSDSVAASLPKIEGQPTQ